MPQAVQDRPFELIAGHPVLDLVNTLDWRFRESGPEDLLADYDDLLRFASQSGLLTTRQISNLVRNATETAAARALAACRELREAAAEVLYAAVDGRTPAEPQIETLERFFKGARKHQRLVWEGSHLVWVWPAAERSPELPVPELPGPELPVWMLSLSAARLMVSEDMHRLRACEAPDCRWLFLDTSKNHTRRWCDMKICGNRMKARRFKAQHKR